MPILREQDFDKMATEVVNQFLSGSAKLADAAAHAAMSAGMNPDQIERLVQSANTMAFLRMMEQRKEQGQDLTHEFDPIDSRQVIRIVIDETGVHVDPGPGMNAGPSMDAGGPPMGGEDELPDEMSGIPEGLPGHEETESPTEEAEEQEAAHDGPFPPAKKKDGPPKKDKKDTSAEKKDDGDEKKEPPKEESPKEAALRQRRQRKLADIMEDQFRQAEWAFEDAYGELAQRFKRAQTAVPYEAFEKDAMVEHGNGPGLAVLNMFRADRGLPALEPTENEKLAALHDHHVSDDTPEMRMFERLVKIATDAAKLRQGVEWLRDQCA